MQRKTNSTKRSIPLKGNLIHAKWILSLAIWFIYWKHETSCCCNSIKGKRNCSTEIIFLGRYHKHSLTLEPLIRIRIRMCTLCSLYNNLCEFFFCCCKKNHFFVRPFFVFSLYFSLCCVYLLSGMNECFTHAQMHRRTKILRRTSLRTF